MNGRPDNKQYGQAEAVASDSDVNCVKEHLHFSCGSGNVVRKIRQKHIVEVGQKLEDFLDNAREQDDAFCSDEDEDDEDEDEYNAHGDHEDGDTSSDERSSSPLTEAELDDAIGFIDKHSKFFEDASWGKQIHASSMKRVSRTYMLLSLDPRNVSLLQCSRQLHDEAAAMLYGHSRFIIGESASEGLLFLDALPGRYLSQITKIGIDRQALYADDEPTRQAWTTYDDGPSFPCSLPLDTPFAAYLAFYMPALQEVSLAVPPGGHDDWFCGFAPLDLMRLLRLGKISKLEYMFTGEVAVSMLQSSDSSFECYQRMVGTLEEMQPELAGEEFLALRPRPANKGRSCQDESDPKVVAWDAELADWLRSDDRQTVWWRWGDRDLSLSGREDVQAVVEYTVKKQTT